MPKTHKKTSKKIDKSYETLSPLRNQLLRRNITATSKKEFKKGMVKELIECGAESLMSYLPTNESDEDDYLGRGLNLRK